MGPINVNTNALPQVYDPSGSQKPSASPENSSGPAGAFSPDVIHLSPAARELALTGRVALNSQAGNLSSDQAQQLYSQIASIHSQIVADQQTNGGTLSSADAQAIEQLQNQLSQTAYSDAHNSAAPPADPAINKADVRVALQGGRSALNEKAGSLTSDQAQQLYSQVTNIYKQVVADQKANGGSLTTSEAPAMQQSQNQLSEEIYDMAHGVTAAPAGQQ
jgi:hypothetical protein